ncbi:MAG: type II secretion system secretin GspD [Thiotrichales bacterium]|nr:MAG: type II secretion system secretin GspD [Thiotrichales bacterium]
MNTQANRSGPRQLFYSLLLALLLCPPVLADEITLNLKDADIRALISTVSKFTGKNFIIDPRVKAKITVVSSETLTPEEVYEVFLSILQVHGYAAVPTGSVVKIVPEVNAKQGPLPLGMTSAEPGDELITKIISLDHVPAAQLVPILRPLVPQQGHLAAYNPTNTLIITDHAGNIQRLMRIIAGVDRAESDELEVIPLQHASAPELVRIVNSLYPQTGKDQANKINLAADERTNSILMSGERAIRLKIRTTIMQLDTPLDDGGGNTHVIYLRYAKAENMVNILTGLQDQKKKTVPGKRPAAAKTPAAARNVAGASFISDTAIIQADEETNALIITADPNTLLTLKSVIRQLDIRRAQVHIEAIIAEISTNRDKEIGVGAVVDGTESSESTFPVGISNLVGLGELIAAAAGSEEAALGVLQNLGSGLTLGVGAETSAGVRYGLILRALQTDSAANILSTPSIVTLDNEEAEIIVAQNLPFITGQFTGTGSLDPSNPFQTIERQDVGLTLKVTPQINEGDTIKLDLEQEVSDVVTITENSGPVTRKRSIKTSVLVDDGGILVLGGLIEEVVDDTKSKVPLLGDIPVIKHLFTSRASTKRKQNLMVFLKPSILRDFTDAAYVTNEKYNYLRAEQMRDEEEDFGLIKGGAPVLPPLEPENLDKAQAKAEADSADTENEPAKSSQPAEDEEDWDDEDFI